MSESTRIHITMRTVVWFCWLQLFIGCFVGLPHITQERLEQESQAKTVMQTCTSILHQENGENPPTTLGNHEAKNHWKKLIQAHLTAALRTYNAQPSLSCRHPPLFCTIMATALPHRDTQPSPRYTPITQHQPHVGVQWSFVQAETKAQAMWC